eukprot:m.193182 g.193182  ORF g.193182 m.193182 type:complete len:749 (+) comp18859_c0_seq1:24-2270(+)
MSVAIESPSRPLGQRKLNAREERARKLKLDKAKLMSPNEPEADASIIPGTPTFDSNDRSISLARAERAIKAQQTRLRSFEDLLDKVKVECDELERSAAVSGFPTPERTSIPHVDTFAGCTPARRLTRTTLAESNPLQRTPKSLPTEFAWDNGICDDQPEQQQPTHDNVYDNANGTMHLYDMGADHTAAASEEDNVDTIEEDETVAPAKAVATPLQFHFPPPPEYMESTDHTQHREESSRHDNGATEATVPPPTASRSRMHVAAAAGDVRALKTLVTGGGSVNAMDGHGRTPLMYALRFDQIRAGQWLVAHGADANHQTHDKSTALHYACFQGTEIAVKFLVQEAGANPRLVDTEGRSPLHWCMHNRSIKVLDALLRYSDLTEEDFNMRDCSGMTSVMWACCYDSVEHLDRLLALGADTRAVDVEGKTAMHWSVRSARSRCLRRLLSYHNSFDMDDKGRSIIHHAAEVGNLRAIRMIVAVRPQAVHDVDDNGRAPLHWAAACKHTATLQLLIKLGAYVGRKDVKGKQAVQYAQKLGFSEGEQVLRDAVAYRSTKPRLGPADASTSLRAFDMPVPAGFVSPSVDARRLFKMLRVGTYLWKYTNDGKGVLHRRYFWLDCFTGELCWCKSPETFARNPSTASSEYIVDVNDGPLDRILARSDYDAKGTHRYAFTLHTATRTIDVLAKDVVGSDGMVTSAERVYRTWIDGLRCLKVYGEHILQGKSGASGGGANARGSQAVESTATNKENIQA